MDGEVWKVVGVGYKGTLRSYLAAGLRYQLPYAKDQVTRPVIGKLFAFKTVEAALKALLFQSPAQLWRAWGTGLEKAPSSIPIHSLSYEEFWKTGTIKGGRWATPDGTVLCDSIKLLERVA